METPYLLQTRTVSRATLTNVQTIGLTVLRVAIGWHFLYEGLAKLINPNWTAAAYLNDSQGLFSPLFLLISSTPAILRAVDVLNMWGLVAIGLGLMSGLFTRYAAIAAMALLILYYLAAPPFPGLEYSIPGEGSYIIVNKNLVECCALMVLVLIPTERLFGLDRLFRKD